MAENERPIDQRRPGDDKPNSADVYRPQTTEPLRWDHTITRGATPDANKDQRKK